MKKIVYLGYLVTPEEANRSSGASVAGNKMQWNIVKNLSKYDDVEITCVTIPPLASFPHDKKIYQRRQTEILLEGVHSIKISFCNLPIIKQFWQICSAYRITKQIVKELDADILFTFNLFPQVGIPMRWLKKKYPHLETVCLLADLPIDDNTNRKGASAMLRKLFEKSTWKSMQVCDKYVVLNKYVIDKYLPGKPYIVVDGGVDEDDIKCYTGSVKKSGEHNILFCGALTEYNGIINLIEAMKLLKDTDVVLDIYGSGYLEEIVKTAAKKNPQIRYYGRIPNQEVMQKQQEAWLLINPRITDDPIAQVTFPSKTFEYLLSGTPVLSTRLNGYGKEYNKQMFFAEEDTPKALEIEIRQILELSSSEINKKASEARTFVITMKSWKVQTERILNFFQNED